MKTRGVLFAQPMQDGHSDVRDPLSSVPVWRQHGCSATLRVAEGDRLPLPCVATEGCPDHVFW